MEKKRHWREEEVNIFFESLIKYGRNWEKIASCIPAKVGEQVRSYYYRLIRKLEKLLNRISFTFDKKDRTDTWIALLCYWELRKDNNFEESSPDFAKEFKERIVKQREALISTRNSVLQNTSDQITLKLFPRSKTIEDLLKNKGLETEITISIKTRKPIATLLRHPLEKFSSLMTQSFGVGAFRLYPHQIINHYGWGTDDQQTTVYFIYNQLGCPQDFILDYDYIVEYNNMYPTTPTFNPQGLYYNVVPQPPSVSENFVKYPSQLNQTQPQKPLQSFMYTAPFNTDENIESYAPQNVYSYSSAPLWPINSSGLYSEKEIPIHLSVEREQPKNENIEKKSIKTKTNHSKQLEKNQTKKQNKDEYDIYNFDDKEIEADLDVLFELSLSNHYMSDQNDQEKKEDDINVRNNDGDKDNDFQKISEEENKTEIDKNEENKEDEGEYEGNVKLDKDDFEGEEDFEKMDKDKEKKIRKRELLIKES